MLHHVEGYAGAPELSSAGGEAAFAAIKTGRIRKRLPLPAGAQAAYDSVDAVMRTLAIQETERRRIASELHDGLGQMLTLLLLELRNAKAALAGCVGGAATEVSLERAAAEARNAMAELRRSVMALYPSILDDLGLVASLTCLLRDVRHAEPQMSIESLVSVADGDIPKSLHIVIFRLVQEAVNNVVKHAGASSLTVTLRKTGALVLLSVQDNGCGVDNPGGTMPRNRRGLAGMVRRAQASRGELTISSSRESGTCLTVIWPKVGVSDPAAACPGS